MSKHQTKKLKKDPISAIGTFSKNLLGLKFMQRAKKEFEKKVELKEEKDEFDSSLCKKLKNKQQYIMNPSFQYCERLKFGRFSYKGMNLEVESMMLKNAELQNNDNNCLALKRSFPQESSSESDNEIDNLDSDNEDSGDDEEGDILDRIQ